MKADGLALYARICGATLARAHARSGDRIAIASYLGSGERFEDAITDYALQYTELNASDYQMLMSGIGDGSITAIRDL
jgi:hypothetical protein